MGLILKFPERERQQGARGAERRGPAEVLFFTGVRYERQADAKPRKVRKRPPASGQRSA